MKLWKKFLKRLRKKEKKRKKKLHKLLLVSFIWVSIMVWSIWLYQQSGMNFEDFLFSIYIYLQENILLWVFAFVAIYLLRPLLFLPATPFEFIAALVYGLWAILIIILSLLFSIITNYIVGMRSKKYVEYWLQDSLILRNFRKYMRGDTFVSVLFLRLMPFPFDIGSFLCWVFRLNFFSYIIASLLWSLPSSIIVFVAGLSFYREEITSFEGMFENVDTRLLSYAGIWFVFLYAAIFFLKRYISKVVD